MPNTMGWAGTTENWSFAKGLMLLSVHRQIYWYIPYLCSIFASITYSSKVEWYVSVLNSIVSKRSSCYSFDDSESVSQRNAGVKLFA